MKNEAVSNENLNYYDFLQELKQVREKCVEKEKVDKRIGKKKERAYVHFMSLIFITILCETFFLLLGFYIFQ